MKPEQLSLFPRRGPFTAAPARPLRLEPSPDEIRLCTSCGEQIVTRRRTAESKVTSEFVSDTGEWRA